MRKTLVRSVRWCLLILLVLLAVLTSRRAETLDNADYKKFVDVGGSLLGGMAFDHHGNLFVAKDGHDIIRITPDGQASHLLTIKDDQLSTSRIRDMKVGPDDAIYVAEDRQIIKIGHEKDVEVVMTMDFTSGQRLSGIGFDAPGNLYVAYDDKVDKYSPSFKREAFFDETLLDVNVMSVGGFAFDMHGQYFILVDGLNKTIFKFPLSPDGKLAAPKAFAVMSRSTPAIGANGDIFTVIWAEATIARIDPQGRIEKIPCPLETLSGFTTVAFGSPGFDEEALYITNSDGQIFTLRVNTREAIP